MIPLSNPRFSKQQSATRTLIYNRFLFDYLREEVLKMHSSLPKKHGSEQTDMVGPTPKWQRSKIVKSTEDGEKKVTVLFISSFELLPNI